MFKEKEGKLLDNKGRLIEMLEDDLSFSSSNSSPPSNKLFDEEMMKMFHLNEGR